MKRIVFGILTAVTAGTAALTLAAAPAHAEGYYQQPAMAYRDGRYGREFRAHQRFERLRRERMRRLWLLRHGYLRDRW
ncbi:MAG: hypothetical protein ABR567_01110 [Myxococcales bacterium]|nr:hypothetical protein [Myxococcales bacterium]